MLRTLLRVCFGSTFSFLALECSAQVTCRPAYSSVDLDINNVRARIYASGYLWGGMYDYTYDVPKDLGLTTIFNGSLWLSGFDPSNQIHMAAGSYFYNYGVEYWPGPLDTSNATTSNSSCEVFDRLWKVDRAQVESFLANRADPNYQIPEAILNWPGNGNTSIGHARFLAPFVDVDGDGIYSAFNGDYPAFNFGGTNNCDYDLLGDQAIWWVFNDKGDIHSETGGQPFGIEVHATAFAYRSTEVNLDNATFYRYKIINRSTTAYHNMRFSNWWEGGSGYNYDDYFASDVARGLAFNYNGDDFDGDTSNGGWYGYHPPAVGIDYLQGPFAEPSDGVDNDRDYVVDEVGERCQMSHALQYTNNCCINDEPNTVIQHDWYMQGIWKDGTHMTYGGNGYGGTQICDYMMPGNSDPNAWGTYGVSMPPWDEVSSWNLGGRRRFVSAVGPFAMQPGEVEIITIAIPWARDTAGDNFDAVERLKEADDYLQNLFDNCFALPCAAQALPEINYTFVKSLAYFTLYGGGTSWAWDFGDGQTSSSQHPSHYYTVPGTYTITVAVTSPCGIYSDTSTLLVPDYLLPCGPEITRLEGQGNGNQELEFTKETIDEILGSSMHRSLFPVYTPMHGPVRISYEDYHELEDGDYRIAFDSIGFNSNWKMWKVGGTDTVYSDTTIGGGIVQRIAMWGLGVQIQQVKSPGYNNNPDRNGYLTSSMTFSDPAKNWLTGMPDDEGHTSDNWIRSGWRSGTGMCVAEFNDRVNGISVIDRNEDYESILGRTWSPYRIAAYNPFVGQWATCYDKGPAWQPSPPSATVQNKFENIANVDVIITSDKSKWTRCCVIEAGPDTALNQGSGFPFHLRVSPSVDQEGRNISSGGSSDPSDPAAADYIGANGMGWFPGYAINLETGERLNMAFAENSTYTQENGRDMLWNPTENEYSQFDGNLWGGCHYIYVFGHNGDATFTTPAALAGQLKDMPLYDYGKAMFTILNYSNTANPELREVYSDAMWTTIPVINPGHSFLESDVTVKLRVQKPYAKYQTDSVPQNNNYPLYGFRIDKYNLDCNAYMGDVTVFPNPFADQSVIHFENTHEHEANLKLYDVQGKLVRELNTTSDRFVISSAGLFSGMYVWTLELEGEKPRTGKVILR